MKEEKDNRNPLKRPMTRKRFIIKNLKTSRNVDK